MGDKNAPGYGRRTVMRSSLLGLVGAGMGRSEGRRIDRVHVDRDESVQDSPATCTAVEKALTDLSTTEPYEHASWGLYVVDLENGKPVHALNPRKFFVPGSTAKLVTISAAWDELGGEHRFRTPIYRTGPVQNGRLDGDLVLVASGDLTMGGRTRPDGQIAYTSLDHTYANAIPGATLTETNPLAGLGDLATQVRESGITHVEGDVLIDARLFEDHDILDPETPLSPIIINDNLIDVLVSPTEPDQPAEVTHRPDTAAYGVRSTVETVGDGTPTEISVSSAREGEILVSGQIAAGSDPVVRVHQIEDPVAFARTALIEALEDADVSVAAPTVGPNRTANLPNANYRSATRVAQLVSPPFSEYAELILKTSHNLGANLMVCLLAVAAGSNDCIDGFAVIHDFLERVGIDTDEVSLSDGRGGAREDHITPRAMIALLSYWHDTTNAEAFKNALPILGVDGSLADVATDSPAAGYVFAKTGTVAGADHLNDRLFLTAQTLGGYVDTDDGRRLAFGLFMNRAGVADIEALLDVVDQLGELTAVIQQHC